MEQGMPAAEVSAPTGDVASSANVQASSQDSAQINVTPAESPAPSQAWHDSFSAENKDFITNKGFQNAESILNSYRNLEKLRGVPEDRLLKLPDAPDAPEWRSIQKKLGMPDNPADYKLQTEGRDALTAEWAQNTFHELGLNTQQAQTIMDKFDEFTHSRNQEVLDKHTSQMEIQEKDLKKEWGMAFDKNIAVARRAADAFGIDDTTLGTLEESMGLNQLMKFLNNVGTKMGEDPYVKGSPIGSGVITPAEAQAKISRLKSDPDFTSKYLNKDVAAREEMSRLHKMAYPEA